MRKPTLHTVIIALGTNHLQESNMEEGRKKLGDLLETATFSCNLWTEAIGIVSPPYLNCLVRGKTRMSLNRLKSTLKSMERTIGDNPEERREGRIHIDLDLLEYDGERHHCADWEREYIKTLYHEIQTI